MTDDILARADYLGLASRLKRLADKLQADAVGAFNTRAYPIQTTHFPLIAALEAYGPLSVGAAAEIMGVSQPAVTRIYTAVQKMGLTDTRPIKGDKRHKEIHFTPAGEALVADMKANFWPDVRIAAEKLCTSDANDFLAHITHIEAALDDSPLHARIEEEADSGGLRIVEFSDDLAHHFEAISREWVQAMFKLEAEDIDIIENPRERIISKGGIILFVEDDVLGIIGTCALMPFEDGAFELTKMGVSANARGKGAGAFIMKKVLQRARRMNMRELFLLTNSKCEAAVHLYEHVGFKHDDDIMQRFGHRYERCNVTMSFALPG